MTQWTGGLGHKLGRGQCCCENLHCSDEDFQLKGRLKKACLAGWGFQLGTHAGWTPEGRAQGCAWAGLCGTTAGIVQRIMFHNPHLCTCTSLNRFSSGQPATWIVGIFFAPNVFCVKTHWMWLGTLGVVGLCFILGFSIFFLGMERMGSCRLQHTTVCTTNTWPACVCPCCCTQRPPDTCLSWATLFVFQKVREEEQTLHHSSQWDPCGHSS